MASPSPPPAAGRKPSRLPFVAAGLVIVLVIAIGYGLTHGSSLSAGGGGLRGKVVLVDFWTYSCINCQNTFPYLRKWNQAYKDNGLVIVGVHSPEFEFEKSVPNIRQAIKHYNVTWPVAADSQMTTWNAHGQALRGGLLLSAYNIGLGLPFVASALVVASFPSVLRPLARFSVVLSRVAGVLLVILGLLLVVGVYRSLAGYLAQPFTLH